MPGLAEWRGSGGAVVRYLPARSFGAVWIAAGGPSGPDGAASRPAAALAFEAAARAAGARPLWFGLGAADAVGAGRPAVVIGAEPVWEAGRWPEVVATKRSVRAQIARARNKGLRAEPWDPARVAASEPLKDVLDDWLGRRGLPPLGFLADPFVLEAGGRLFWVAVLEGEPVGYLALVPGDGAPGGEVLVEWVIRGRDAPNGTAAFLLDAAVRSLPPGSAFTLGLVPLSTYAPLSERRPGPAVRALLAWVRAHAARFYNVEGLERFKAKFVPDRWRPLWLVTDGRPVTLWTFHAVAAAFSAPRGPTRFVARALADAALEEARRLRR